MDAPQVSAQDVELSHRLLSFIRTSPSPFHVVESVRERLERAGFTYLPEDARWNVVPGGSYYTVRNGSSIVAMRVGERVASPRFMVVASHSDSPTFRLKDRAELHGPGSYLRLDTEAYGGTIDRTWLDRPLSIAGRVMVDRGERIKSHLLSFDRDLLVIPSVAVHMDRRVNEEGAIDRRSDLFPLFSAGGMDAGAFVRLVADELGVEPEQVLGHDLMLVNRQAGSVWGAANEFVSAPRIDDLQCAYAALVAFLSACHPTSVGVYACLNNEEVGSGTLQGALSTFVPSVLERVCLCLGEGREGYHCALARSFVVSCDNAHAVHPNHPELHDEENRVWINGGVVIKEAARQTYATDALSRALFVRVCREAGVPTQSFANRSDLPGGSTLGNLLMRTASMHTVDVGLPQLAMHSSYETAGTCDTGYLAKALQAFYDTDYRLGADDALSVAVQA